MGDEFEGIVAAVTSFGLFVELKDLYVEGLVHITNLPHDYYHFEAAQHRLIGERTRQVFRLGDELSVRVAGVNLDDRKVDLEMTGFKKSSRKKSAKKNDRDERPINVSKNARRLAEAHEEERNRKKSGKGKGRGKAISTDSKPRKKRSAVTEDGKKATAKPAKRGGKKPSKGSQVRKTKSAKPSTFKKR